MEKEKVITLIDAFKDFKEEKNIDRPVMMQVLKDVFLTQIAKTCLLYTSPSPRDS